MQDYTQIVGISVFAISAVAALLRRERPWTIIGLTHALMSVEVAMNWRYKLHDLAVSLLTKEAVYQDRTPWQVVFLVILMPVGAFALARTFRALRGRTLQVAGVATMAMVLLFAAMIISLHAVDRVLYAPVGPILLGAWLWVAGAATVVWCAQRGR